MEEKEATLQIPIQPNNNNNNNQDEEDNNNNINNNVGETTNGHQEPIFKTITPSKHGFISARKEQTPLNSARSNTSQKSAPGMFSPDKVPRTSGKPILTPLPPSVLSSSLLGGLLSGRSSSSSRRNQVITRNSPLKQGTKNYLAESIVPLLIEGLTQLSISRPEKSDNSPGPAVWLAKYLLRRSDQSKDYILKRRRGGIEVEVQTEDTEQYSRKKEVVHMETQTDKASGSSLSAIRELNGSSNNNNNTTNVNQNRDININIRLDGALLPSRMMTMNNNNMNNNNAMPSSESYDVFLGNSNNNNNNNNTLQQPLLQPAVQPNILAAPPSPTVNNNNNYNNNETSRKPLLLVDDAEDEVKSADIPDINNENIIENKDIVVKKVVQTEEQENNDDRIRNQNIEKLKSFFEEICAQGHVPKNSLIVSRRQFQRAILSLGLQSMLASSIATVNNNDNNKNIDKDKSKLPGLSMLMKPRQYKQALDKMTNSTNDNTITYSQFEEFCFKGIARSADEEEKTEQVDNVETKEEIVQKQSKSNNTIFTNTITYEELQSLENDLQKTIDSKRPKTLSEVDTVIDNVFTSIFDDPQINSNSIDGSENDRNDDQVRKEDVIFLLGMSPPNSILDYAEIMPSFQFLMNPQIYENELVNYNEMETIKRVEFMNFIKQQIAILNKKETIDSLVLDDYMNNAILITTDDKTLDDNNTIETPSSSPTRRRNLGTPYDEFSSARIETSTTSKLRLDKSLKKIFNTLDSKKDGFLDKREVLLSLSGRGNAKVANLLSYFQPLEALLKPKTFQEAFNIMDTESSGKVNFDEFRAFCNAVVIEAEEIALSGRPSVDENGEDIIMDSARLSARVVKELERDIALRTLFNKVGASLSNINNNGNNNNNKAIEEEEEEKERQTNKKSKGPYLSKRYILRALHSNPSIVALLDNEPILFALCKPQSFGATFDTMNVEKDGKVSWLEFRAFCTAVSDDNMEENNMNINSNLESAMV